MKRKKKVPDGTEIPKGALRGDPSKQMPSGISNKLYYQDVKYKCAGCGVEGVWTAEQQKKYFEEQRGNIYNTPKWCAKCHKKRLEEERERRKNKDDK